MSYAAAIESLFALAGELHSAPGTPRRKFRLEDMRILLSALGDPQRRFQSVLVAGTNGKGSTAATLASILSSAGYEAGLYTSPHLSRVNERVQIHGESIRDDDFAELYFQVDDASVRLVAEGQLAAHPSFFETMTALAFLHFAESGVPIAVLEVGMGGRLDATNVVDPLLSIITDVSLDHTEWLGSTIDAIAREKAGILRESGVLITLPQHPEANHAIGEIAVALNVRAISAATYVPVRNHREEYSRNRYPLSVLGEAIQIDSPLNGQHQQRNLALAITAAVELRNSCGYEISPLDIEDGIRKTVWPGRLELFKGSGRQAEVLLDVAHNPAGAWALRAAISKMTEEEPRPLTLVFGCLRDKAIGEIASILFPLFDRVFLVPVDSPRAATMEELAAAAVATGSKFEQEPDAISALRDALEAAPADGLIVVSGSVYLVGALRAQLASLASKPGSDPRSSAQGQRA
jgi:dihydrofolate synthase / folylpolyglutamate synthase